MENDGEKYYIEQAELNMGNSLHTVCMMLAEEEKIHAEILGSKMNSLPYKMQNSEIYTKTRNIFDKAGDFKSIIKELPSQLDFYRFVLENEQKSIDLYEDFLSGVQNDKDKDLFNFLIAQEKVHYKIIDELIKLLSHAKQWVESAEFGIREDY